MSHYRKLIAALVGAATATVTVLPDGITAAEGLTIAVAFLTALGVYAVPNVASERPRDEHGRFAPQDG